MNRVLFIFVILIFGLSCTAQELVQDDFLMQVLSEKEIVKPETNLDYNYEDLTRIKIPIKLKEKIRSILNLQAVSANM